MITGDVTQIDLPNARRSGLLEAVDVLKNVEGLTFAYFDETDVVRHQLVQRIIRAYDEHKAKAAEQTAAAGIQDERQSQRDRDGARPEQTACPPRK